MEKNGQLMQSLQNLCPKKQFKRKIKKYSELFKGNVIPIVVGYKGHLHEESIKLIKEHIKEIDLEKLNLVTMFAIIRASYLSGLVYQQKVKDRIME